MKKSRMLVFTVLFIVCMATQVLAGAPYVPIFNEGNNLTIIDGSGNVILGTNDVHFDWDGTLKTKVVATGQVANANISSICSSGTGTSWTTHDVAVYGPGTYTVFSGCRAGRPGCGNGPAITFTVGANEIGVHMLVNWGLATSGTTTNIDVVNVWTMNSQFAPSSLSTAGCGTNAADKVWDLMSRPSPTTPTINGYPMVDGPFVGQRFNFNLMGAPINRVVDTANNNFTMNPGGASLTPGIAFGGTNDIRFTWDGTKKTSVAVSGQVGNASVSSSCPFFGNPWWSHDMVVYGPGTYTVYTGCPAGSPGCGTGIPYTFTVKPGELGAHMLFLWSGNENIDVVDVWRQGLYEQGYAPSCVDNGWVPVMWTGACGTGDPAKVWDWMSYDWEGDCVNGSDMVDGPFQGQNANFNVMGFIPCTLDTDCDPSACNTSYCDTGSGRCVYTPISCDDGLFCTTDSCVEPTGCVHTPVVCNSDDNPCTADTCDTATGECNYPNLPDGTSCEDGNACTVADTCQIGVCTAGTPKDCNDNNTCTTDSCNPVTGQCSHTNICFTQEPITWYNTGTGQVIVQTTDGNTITGETGIWWEPDTTWSIVGKGDFDGDGVIDYVWRNSVEGYVFLQFMTDATTVKSWAFVWTEPDQHWKIVATGDLNGDGKTDLIWWNNSTGQVYGMLMNGSSAPTAASMWVEPDVSHWRIVAAGDLNNDGKADLIWWNSSTGQVYGMLMNGLSVTSTGGIWTEPNTNWRIVGAGDINGDGRADLIWRNRTTGQVFGMQMNGLNVTSTGGIWTEPNMNWEIVSIDKYNGDTKADLLWRNKTSGQVFLMLMNGFSVSSSAFIWVEPSMTWRILGDTEWKNNAYGAGVVTP